MVRVMTRPSRRHSNDGTVQLPFDRAVNEPGTEAVCRGRCRKLRSAALNLQSQAKLRSFHLKSDLDDPIGGGEPCILPRWVAEFVKD